MCAHHLTCNRVLTYLPQFRRIGLDEFLRQAIPEGREDVPWARMALTLVLGRLCDPSSELRLAESVYRRSALDDVLGIPVEKVNDDRLYRALDALLPHKEKLEVFLKERLGTLFHLKYDLILYDVTSTYFEGEQAANALAQRGYSRDHRPDCKQVCVALVVSKEGIPLGHEVFAGNRTDVTTLEEIVETMEGRYGASDCIWVVDRGMVSEENMRYLREDGRRYIVGTPRTMLKRFERELLSAGWEAIREGLEVKRCPGPEAEEAFILCRSVDRREKEKAMHERFEKRIEQGLEKIARARLRRAAAGPAEDRPADRRALGRQLPGGGALRCARGDRRRRPPQNRMEESRGVAPVGGAQRRLLSLAQQRQRLERGESLDGVHPAHRSGSRLSRPQERPPASSDLASERGARQGAHPRVLSGVRPVENSEPALPAGGDRR